VGPSFSLRDSPYKVGRLARNLPVFAGARWLRVAIGEKVISRPAHVSSSSEILHSLREHIKFTIK
jgi:hypothetical protein